nr:MAG TPA: hypothetical protein [Caudoviricetes sp.]DAR38615.1 MAG TPA: hypothetical protein [Caudoviricetes sp.]
MLPVRKGARRTEMVVDKCQKFMRLYSKEQVYRLVNHTALA